MTTADYALIISLFSATITLGNLIWNVWSKFIYPKPSLRIRASVMSVIERGERVDAPFVNLSMTNHGPGEIIISHAAVRIRQRGWKNSRWALINPMVDLQNRELPGGPFAGGLPKTISAGQSFSLYFPFEPGGWLVEPIACFGVQDTLDRYHWITRRDLRKLKAKYNADFAAGAASQDAALAG